MSTLKSTDVQDVDGLLNKLKHGLSAYDTATKKYLSAVKELESAMEGIAIAVREIAQESSDAHVGAAVDGFCSAVDAHKATASRKSVHGRSGAKNGSSFADASALSANNRNGDAASGLAYNFSNYMSDFSRETSLALDALKTTIRQTEKLRDEHKSAVRAYTKAREAVDKRETKLAKRNATVAGDAKYSAIVDKRNGLKARAEGQESAFIKSREALQAQQTKTLCNLLNAMCTRSSTYFDGLGELMRRGIVSP